MAKKPVVKPTNEPKKEANAEKGSVEKVDSGLATADKATALPKTQIPKPKRSLSSKALSVIALLFAGGAAALYGGPKLAPMLPSGLSPVANFFSPGEAAASDKIQALSADLSARLELLESAKAPDVSEQFQSLSGEINEKITNLSDQVAASDSQDIEARLTAVETQLSGLTAQVSSLGQNLSGVEAGDATAELSAYQAVIDGLKAEIATLSSKQGLIGQRIDEVTATTDRRVEQANETISEITRSKALSDIATALEAGNSFTDALMMLTDGGVDVPPALNDVANGVTTLANLKSSFSAAAHAAIKASFNQDKPADLTGKVASFFKSQVTVRSLEPQEGMSADAILSRVQAAMDAEDLGVALSQANDLSGASKAAMETWLSAAKTRQAALDAVAALTAN
jgi:hypothetical protein